MFVRVTINCHLIAKLSYWVLWRMLYRKLDKFFLTIKKHNLAIIVHPLYTLFSLVYTLLIMSDKIWNEYIKDSLNGFVDRTYNDEIVEIKVKRYLRKDRLKKKWIKVTRKVWIDEDIVSDRKKWKGRMWVPSLHLRGIKNEIVFSLVLYFCTVFVFHENLRVCRKYIF